MNRVITLLFLIIVSQNTFSQVGIGTVTPQAALDVTATNKGILIPRVELSARNVATILTPKVSEMVYNTASSAAAVSQINKVTPGFYYWGDSLWIRVVDAQSNTSFNTFKQFAERPTNLLPIDSGKKYLFTQTGNFHLWTGTTWQVLNESIINVKDYGAMGDGLGKTPAESGIDITNEIWNTWDNSLFKTDHIYSPYYANNTNTFQPPRSKPYQNDDTWDYIGIMRSLSYRKGIFIPSGKFLINLSQTNRGGPGTTGIVMMRGQEQAITGAGAYHTIISSKEDYAYFSNNNMNIPNYYSLFALYRISGIPTQINDIAFAGPENYGINSNNLTLINSLNVNGVTIRDCWLVAASRGLSFAIQSSDSFIKGVTTEFLFQSSVDIDSTCYEIAIDFCNFWASANNVLNQRGVYSLSNTIITNTKFVEFGGNAVVSKGGIFNSNTVFLKGGNNNLLFQGNIVFNGNRITGNSNGAALRTGSNSTISGNYFNITGSHPCIDLGNGVVAKNVIISNNTLIKTDITSVNPDNKILISTIDGVSYYNAADSSCLITNNICQGNFQTPIGSSHIIQNIVNGVFN